jgi:hypothetical protein
VGSHSSLSQGHHRLLECHSSHKLCQSRFSSFVPRGLLKIEIDDRQNMIRLVEVLEEQHIQWTALSFVWGGDQVVKTTVASLPASKQSWLVDKLLRAIQDAVAVCRSLFLSYL